MIDGAFEHHLKYDLSGYPKLVRKRKLTLFGRIVALADFYDALVRPRVYNRYPYVSEKILGIMLERSGKDFDPALVKVFINMIGIFPDGDPGFAQYQRDGNCAKIQEDLGTDRSAQGMPDLLQRGRISKRKGRRHGGNR